MFRSAISVGLSGKAVLGMGAELSVVTNLNGDVFVQSGVTHGAGVNLGPIVSWQFIGNDPAGVYSRWTARGGVGVTAIHSKEGWTLSIDLSPGIEFSSGFGIAKKY